MRRRSAGKKKSNHTALWVGGAVALGVVGIILYERKPAAASSGGSISPAPSGNDSATFSPSPPASPAIDLSSISLPTPNFTSSSIAVAPPPPAPLPVTPVSYTAPNAPRVVSLLWPGGTWKQAVSGTTYASGSHVRMQVTGAANGYLDTVKKQMAGNTFGAWNVTAYPPGSGNPKSWPDGDTSTYRLEFILNKATVLSSGTFGMQAWVYSK